MKSGYVLQNINFHQPPRLWLDSNIKQKFVLRLKMQDNPSANSYNIIYKMNGGYIKNIPVERHSHARCPYTKSFKQKRVNAIRHGSFVEQISKDWKEKVLLAMLVWPLSETFHGCRSADKSQGWNACLYRAVAKAIRTEPVEVTHATWN